MLKVSEPSSSLREVCKMLFKRLQDKIRYLVYSLQELHYVEARWRKNCHQSDLNLITLLMILLLWLPQGSSDVVKLVKCYIQLIMCKCLINLIMSLTYVIILENPFTNFAKKKKCTKCLHNHSYSQHQLLFFFTF